LQQFFKWYSEDEELPNPMTRLKPPKVGEKVVPVFTPEELKLLSKTCNGRTFADRRDRAIIDLFTATGIRLSELAGIVYDPERPDRSDLDLENRELHVHGKGRRDRIVKFDYNAARSIDRYLRLRGTHARAHSPRLWLGVNNRVPMTPNGIYQMIARRGAQCGVVVNPHKFRHHFSHSWLDKGGNEGDLMELNGWSSPRCSNATAPAPATPEPAAPTTASCPKIGKSLGHGRPIYDHRRDRRKRLCGDFS
jgi:site-specific recombinase XerD